MTPTPLYLLYKDHRGNSIYIKRDDLLPFSFGGNKVRIAEAFFQHMERLGKNCIIGYGNARSNLSRAIANMAAAKGICCHIISPDDEDGTRSETSNSRIVSSCGAVFHTCPKTQVSQTVDHVMASCLAQGLSPYYIYGDRFGKGNEATPVAAYAKAYGEIRMQAPTELDLIFLPTGTVMNHAGLLAGQAASGGSEQIIGISVARSKEAETEILKNYVNSYIKKTNCASISTERYYVTDSYLCGGYGCYDERISEVISRIMRSYGVPLDPTYTGKAFYGMEQWLEEHDVREKNILFLHTGGTPLYFDHLAQGPVTMCKDKAQLLRFLQRIDHQLPTPLSDRVELESYARKALTCGHILGIEKNAELICAAMFYCNDTQTRQAYLTLLGTLEGHEHRGYAGRVLSAAEASCARNGMLALHLDTEHTNHDAIRFYKKHGYKETASGQKLHLVKEL